MPLPHLRGACRLALAASVLALFGAGPGAAYAADTSAPTTPRLSATVAAGKVTLNWTASYDNIRLSDYGVWRNRQSSTSWPEMGRFTGTTYTDTSVAAGATYTYVVRARDTSNNWSPASNAVTVSVPTAATPTPTPSPSGSGQLIFEDNFDGPSGSSPNSSKWTADNTGFRDNTNEMQYYTNRPANVDLDGSGYLRIRAQRESYGGRSWTSARLSTEPPGRNAANPPKFTFYTGRLEARVKVPRGQGLLSQFWALGRNDYTNKNVGWPAAGELDVMEIIGQDSFTDTANAHMTGYDFNSWPRDSLRQTDLSTGFHTYAMDWYPDRVLFSIDGQVFSTLTKATVQAAGGTWPFSDPDNPFWVIVNLCVGNPWPGAPTSSTPSVATMLVDYVRVWSR
jgi:beta-glucanase (GH16 family)